MRKLKLVVFLAWVAAATASLTAQLPLDTKFRHAAESDTTYKRLITPKLSAFISEMLTDFQTPGLSLGVVHIDALTREVDKEYGSWGLRTEDGDITTQDVSYLS